MMETWGRSVEQVLLAAVESKARVLGVISPDGNSGVSTLCREVADAAVHAGSRTLLVDLAQPVLAGKGGWKPGDSAIQAITSQAGSYDSLAVQPTADTRQLFNNIGALQNLFKHELRDYDQIIVDLPPVLHRKPDFLNPAAAARAADMVIMVCVAGRVTQGRLKSAISALEAAGVDLGGVILNDIENPPLGLRLAESARRLARWSPRLAAMLEQRVLANELLNSPI